MRDKSEQLLKTAEAAGITIYMAEGTPGDTIPALSVANGNSKTVLERIGQGAMALVNGTAAGVIAGGATIAIAGEVAVRTVGASQVSIGIVIGAAAAFALTAASASLMNSAKKMAADEPDASANDDDPEYSPR